MSGERAERPERGEHVLVARVSVEGALAEDRGGVELRRVEVGAPTSARGALRPRARRQLASRECRRGSRSSPTFTQICTPSRRCSARSTQTASTRSGASATSSATGRGRTSAQRSCASGRRICLAGNHDLVVLGKIESERVRRRGGRGGAVDDERARAGRARLPRARSRPAARSRARSSSTAARIDPIWDYVLTDADGARAASRRPRRRSCSSGTATSRSASPLAAGALVRRAGTRRHGARARRATGCSSTPARSGQPRDGDPRAAWLEIDNGSGRARFRRIDIPGRADASGDA